MWIKGQADRDAYLWNIRPGTEPGYDADAVNARLAANTDSGGPDAFTDDDWRELNALAGDSEHPLDEDDEDAENEEGEDDDKEQFDEAEAYPDEFPGALDYDPDAEPANARFYAVGDELTADDMRFKVQAIEAGPTPDEDTIALLPLDENGRTGLGGQLWQRAQLAANGLHFVAAPELQAATPHEDRPVYPGPLTRGEYESAQARAALGGRPLAVGDSFEHAGCTWRIDALYTHTHPSDRMADTIDASTLVAGRWQPHHLTRREFQERFKRDFLFHGEERKPRAPQTTPEPEPAAAPAPFAVGDHEVGALRHLVHLEGDEDDDIPWLIAAITASNNGNPDNDLVHLTRGTAYDHEEMEWTRADLLAEFGMTIAGEATAGKADPQPAPAPKPEPEPEPAPAQAFTDCYIGDTFEYIKPNGNRVPPRIFRGINNAGYVTVQDPDDPEDVLTTSIRVLDGQPSGNVRFNNWERKLPDPPPPDPFAELRWLIDAALKQHANDPAAIARSVAVNTRDRPLADDAQDPDELRRAAERIAASAAFHALASTLVPALDANGPLIERAIDFTVPGCSRPVLGYIDLITADAIIDFKVTHAHWSEDEAANSTQGLFYTYPFRPAPPPFQHVVLVAGKRDVDIQQFTHSYGAAQYRWLETLIRTVNTAMESRAWPPNPTGWTCTRTQCPFFQDCRDTGHTYPD